METKDIVAKQLELMNLNIDDLNPKTLELIKQTEELMMKIISEIETKISNTLKEEINVKTISERLDISRQAIYRNHPDLVKYINFRAEHYNNKISNIINVNIEMYIFDHIRMYILLFNHNHHNNP